MTTIAPPVRLPHRPARPVALPAVVGAGLRVPVLGGDEVPYANLDHAATAPALEAVAARVAELLPYYASVHRGAGLPSRVCTAAYEGARASVARALDAREDDLVVLARNTTDALNLLAAAVPGEGEVVFLDLEHHANLLPWRARAHRCVPVADTLEETLERLAAALRARPAALLSVTGASNVTGEVAPLAALAELAHAHGARIAVDAAQLAPHRRLSIRALGLDYVALSGHKLYAPYGAGALVGRRDWLDAAGPHLRGGGAVRDVTGKGAVWATGAARHEAGTPNVLGAVALGEALRTLGALPAGRLEAHEARLRERLLAGLGRIPGARAHRVWRDAQDVIGVVALSVAGHDPGLLGAALSAEHGVGVRAGRFCAHPLLARLGVPGGALRASVGLGTRTEDVDRLVRGLEAIVDEGPRARYTRDEDGHWAPAADDRPLPAWLAPSS